MDLFYIINFVIGFIVIFPTRFILIMGKQIVLMTQIAVQNYCGLFEMKTITSTDPTKEKSLPDNENHVDFTIKLHFYFTFFVSGV